MIKKFLSRKHPKNTCMKYILVSIVGFFSICTSFAQQQTSKQAQETAKNLLQKSDFDGAIVALEHASKQDPANIELLKDLSFTNYLKRDFARAITVAKPLVGRPDADEQAFQILGLSYKALAEYKEAGKLYRNALKKFSNSGVIYNEYGELLAMDHNLDDAIGQWEKGIELAPNYSSNYFNAAMYYRGRNDWIRVLLYGELFLNLESYTARANDFKKELLYAYRSLFTPFNIQRLSAAKATTAFEKAVLEVLDKTAPLAKDGVDMSNITTIRTRFILEWFQGRQQQYPYRLFDHLQYLLREGLFEAYDQWLFGAAVNEDAYRLWQNNHHKEAEAYKNFQQNRVFKMPTGQYYMAR
ncbi:MAG: hypothetical protein NVS3B15_01820 [Sediminibacterium sp.]